MICEVYKTVTSMQVHIWLSNTKEFNQSATQKYSENCVSKSKAALKNMTKYFSV